jgi:acetyltransferase-like isoleucine patch superfamily enzyme
MPSSLSKISNHCRYTLPFWLVGLLTNWLPEHEWVCALRGWLARPFIGKCGKGLLLGSQVVILCSEKLVVGNLVYIARGTWLNCFGGMTIDDEVVIGPYVVISTDQYQIKDQSFRMGKSVVSPVSIGRGSWLGAHVSVKAGVAIGPGNLVAGNASVVKDTPANVMVGGVPARIIRTHEGTSSGPESE